MENAVNLRATSGVQAPAQARLQGPQSVLASGLSLGAKGQSREASLLSNYLGGNLKDIPIACEAMCQVWCLFASVFISQSFFLCTPGNWLDASSGLLME